jgi:hypothetical protein
MYGGLATISDNFSLLAHVELMKSWDALESNKILIGCPNSNKVPTSTSSLSEIFSTVVWLTRPLLSVGALSCPLA